MAIVTDLDLKKEISDLRERLPRRSDDELFVVWFLISFLTDNEKDALEAIVGGAHDKGIDAILIENKTKSITIIQGKYRQRVGALGEPRTDVLSFAEMSQKLDDDGLFKEFCKNLKTETATRLLESRKLLLKHGYSLRLYYVTCGKCSENLQKEAQRCDRGVSFPCVIDVVDGKEVLRLLSDYLDGVAPPVPTLDVEIEGGRGITVKGILHRFDGSNEIESFAFPVSVSNVAEMFEQAGVRLFARNVRGFLGNTPINRNMEDTLEHEPGFFWYYNNGITIICDKAEKISSGGRDIVRLTNPQVINGQQTTRTLYKNATKGSAASVLVRIISIDRGTDEQTKRYEKLVSKIVAATNWQNAIRASDLMANDRRQIELERSLRKLGYLYIRKRQSKGEARGLSGLRFRMTIGKDELAQAVAACDMDPSIVRDGKEGLFEERYYDKIFPTSNVYYYLARFHLVQHVAKVARGYPERAYAKWLVAHFLWQKIEGSLSSNGAKERFVKECEKFWSDSLIKMTSATFRSVKGFFILRRGKGEKAIDVSSFFRKRGLHIYFASYWKGSRNLHKGPFQKGLKEFLAEMKKLA